MNWLSSSTAWLFYSGSGNLNYLYDILEGANRLKGRGVTLQNCYFFVPKSFSQELHRLGFSQVFDYTEFNKPIISTKIHSEQLVFVGTGHGNQFGLNYLDLATNTTKALTPSDLMSTVRSVQGLKKAVIVLGQCFAGVFNYLDAKKDGEPEICLIGATNFDSSLNHWVDGKRKDIYLNFYIFFFFVWIGVSRHTAFRVSPQI